MIFVTTDKDTFEIEINKTNNNGLVMHTTANDWKKTKLEIISKE
jgi:hypothetical protein